MCHIVGSTAEGRAVNLQRRKFQGKAVITMNRTLGIKPKPEKPGNAIFNPKQQLQ